MNLQIRRIRYACRQFCAIIRYVGRTNFKLNISDFRFFECALWFLAEDTEFAEENTENLNRNLIILTWMRDCKWVRSSPSEQYWVSLLAESVFLAPRRDEHEECALQKSEHRKSLMVNHQSLIELTPIEIRSFAFEIVLGPLFFPRPHGSQCGDV